MGQQKILQLCRNNEHATSDITVEQMRERTRSRSALKFTTLDSATTNTRISYENK